MLYQRPLFDFDSASSSDILIVLDETRIFARVYCVGPHVYLLSAGALDEYPSILSAY